MACIDMGRERTDVHNITTSQVLSNVCFLMQMTASYDMSQRYSVLISAISGFSVLSTQLFPTSLTNTRSIKFTFILKPYKGYLKPKQNP